MVWTLFLLLTGFQMMANSFHAFINLENYIPWIELFGLEEAEPIFQKRVLSIVSGAVLPIVALGFIKSLVDYIRPEQPSEEPLEILSTDDHIELSSPLENVSELNVITNHNKEDEPILEDLKVGNIIVEPRVFSNPKKYNPKP